MFDLKPEAPDEIRGEFKPINTNVPGIQISELMPRVAGMMDKFSIIRSLVGAEGRHDSFECCTGHHFRSAQPQGAGLPWVRRFQKSKGQSTRLSPLTSIYLIRWHTIPGTSKAPAFSDWNTPRFDRMDA